ncbi:phage major capsid protein [Bacillus cihuensis]|uniref:phage major capsid protein n=1 Tax=Bacillus cihuensis TaxID=1208599 RepID=UPI0004094D57|nr:phage major capsid protein [Bacillus cihuensis]
MKMELRSNKTTLASNGDLVVAGYVNKPGQLSEVLGAAKKFREKIAPGAFSKAIENRNREIDFLAEHNNKQILASTRNDSLTLREDGEGLFMEARISPTTWGQDYFTLISEGLIQNMSFGFRALKDTWEMVEGVAVRTVHELELFEVSAVKDPAYSQSTIAARNIEVNDVEVPDEISESSENKKDERGNVQMAEMKMETRTNEFEQILRGETRALQTTADGGSLIPENVQGEIIKKMEESSAVFAKARKLGSVAGTLRVNREDDKVVAGFVGEGENVLESAIGFTHVDLKQKRVGAALTLTNQLINDAAVNIAEYSKDLLARRTAKAVEKSILVGKGGLEFNGIVNDADIKAVKPEGAVTLEDLQELYLAIHPEFLNGASFIMSREFFNKIAKMKDNQGHYYIQNGIVNGKLTYTLFGMAIDVTDALTAEVPVLFGNVTEAYSVMVKQEAGIQEIVDSVQALRGSKLFVFDAYMDGAVVNPQAIAKLVLA